jgi:hypothetical protein
MAKSIFRNSQSSINQRHQIRAGIIEPDYCERHLLALLQQLAAVGLNKVKHETAE